MVPPLEENEECPLRVGLQLLVQNALAQPRNLFFLKKLFFPFVFAGTDFRSHSVLPTKNERMRW